MAEQAIRFNAPPGQTITLDVVDISDDSLQQSALTCTESSNDKGTYTTASFTDTLTGRHSIIKKIGGTAFGKDYVTLANASATYQSDEYKLLIAGSDVSADKLRKFFTNAREPISGAATGFQRFRVYEDDGTTTAFDLDWKTTNGTIEPV
jgi:hypothetical protein